MKSPWKSSPALDSIRGRAEELRSRLKNLPDRITAGRLARFLGLSKTPVLEWIRRGNLTAVRCVRRWWLEKDQVERLIDAAVDAEPYERKHPPTFYKLWRAKQRVVLPDQKTFTFAEIAAHFGCSVATVRRAVATDNLEARHRTPRRWIVTRQALESGYPFGRRIRRPPPAPPRIRTIRLPRKALFSTAEVGRFLGVSQQTVRNLVHAGRLVGVRLGTRKLSIEHASLRAYVRQMGGTVSR